MAGHGGKRKGAGRRQGSKNRATLEQQAVVDAFNQRVMIQSDALFNAQLMLAVGSMKVFRIDEEGEGKSKKQVHSLVTDADEIKALLDEHDGMSGAVDGVYYYFTTVSPDNKAIDSLLNRGLGKPAETVKFNVADIDAEIERRLASLAAGSERTLTSEAESESVN